MDQEATQRKRVMGFPRGTRTEVLWADKEEEVEEDGEGEEEVGERKEEEGEGEEKEKQTKTKPSSRALPDACLICSVSRGRPMSPSNHLVGQVILDCE